MFCKCRLYAYGCSELLGYFDGDLKQPERRRLEYQQLPFRSGAVDRDGYVTDCIARCCDGWADGYTDGYAGAKQQLHDEPNGYP